MDAIRQYLLTVIIGAMICAIATKLCGKSSANSAIVKLLAEIFMLILLVSPLLKLKISDMTLIFEDDTFAADAIAAGESYADEQTEGLIKESITAYILDKASTLDADVRVEIDLSDTVPQVPNSIVIYGDVSPYTKTVLKRMIADELGIPEESQIWM